MKLLNQYQYLVILFLLLTVIESCSNTENNEAVENTEVSSTSPKEEVKNDTNLTKPKSYVLFDEIIGDLNGDGLSDDVLIIETKKKENYVEDEVHGELNRNRRGILIYFNKENGSELVTQNLYCFSSENEDGGVYFPPELSIEIQDGKLFIHYYHGRYGYWEYTFRYDNADFNLIGYDASESLGPVVNREISINFLTKKQFVKKNVEPNIDKNGDEVFEETWSSIEVEELLKLSEIKDFDMLQVE